VVDGWHIVEYSRAIRWLWVVICVAMASCGTFLIVNLLEGGRTARGSRAIAVLIILTVVLLTIYGMLFTWRNWVKYNGETLISGTTWKRPRTFRRADLKFTGAVGPRGHEYRTAAGDAAYVNSYQQGASELIDMLSRQ
jgi:amino acid transporter